MIKRISAAMTFSALALAIAAPAAAYEVRQHFSACTPSLSYTNWVDGRNTTTSNTVPLYCPAPSNTSIQNSTVSYLNVHIDRPDASYTSSALRCVSFWNAAGGACGNLAYSSGTGTIAISPPNSPASFAGHWNYNAHFGSVLVYLGPNHTLKGTYFAN